jgi:hypothetical protein
VLSLAGLLIAGASAARPGFAQRSDRDQRRQFVEGLLRTLVESQMERHLRPRDEAPPQPSRLSPRARQAHQTLTSFSQESTQLVQGLEREAETNPAVRRYLGDAMRVKAGATVLAERTLRAAELDSLTDEYRSLDRDWRVLSHRLHQLPGLGEGCCQCVDRLDGYGKTLCGIFQVEPQISYRDLLRLADVLVADLRDVVEDVEIELGRSERCQALVLAGRRTQQAAHGLVIAVQEQRSYNDIVAEFRKFHTLWEPFSADLWALNSRYVERSLRRMEQIDRDIHERLWLPQPIRRRHLQHLTSVLTQRVDELFDVVSLNVLIELPPTANVLNTAGQFYGACEQFAYAVQQDESPDALREDFACLQEAWPELAGCFRGVRQGEVVNLLKEIEQTFVSMREALQIHVVLDRRLAAERAAELEHLVEHLNRALRHDHLSAERHNDRFRARAQLLGGQLTAAARELHEGVVAGRGIDDLRRSCLRFSGLWNDFYGGLVPEMRPSGRQHVQPIAARITPLVVELQTMFGF